MLHLYERHCRVQGEAPTVLALISQTLYRQMVETITCLPSVQTALG